MLHIALLVIALQAQPPTPSVAKPSGDQQQAGERPQAENQPNQQPATPPPATPPPAQSTPPVVMPSQLVVQQTNDKQDGKSTAENLITIGLAVLTLWVLWWQTRLMARQAAIANKQFELGEAQQ